MAETQTPRKHPPSTRQVDAQAAQAGAQEAQVLLTAVEKAILGACANEPCTGQELAAASGYRTRTGNFKRSLDKLLSSGLIEMTIPDKPRSSKQRYRLTAAGIAYLSRPEEKKPAKKGRSQ